MKSKITFIFSFIPKDSKVYFIIPFPGPHKCMGDQLAKNELFLIFTKIMQRFDIDFAPGDRPEVFDDGFGKGAILRPNSMRVRFLPRKIHEHGE